MYVATIEKANSLSNSLIELQRIAEVGLVVIDEFHMLGDGGQRGATLEACVAKIKLSAGSTTQLVGMSATLNNIAELASFLGAQVYSSDFRPVELSEYVKVGSHLYRMECTKGAAKIVDLLPVRQIRPPPSHLSRLDPDQLCSLVLEVVPRGSCLIFCPTKKNCQNVALLLAKCMPKNREDMEARRDLLQQLGIEAAGVCPILKQTVPCGVAYHHSGLTADERKVVEEGYLQGSLLVLACTSTLAAGVNLPAKRVILRSPHVGNQLLTRNQYKQMVGRAGRSGLCERGESILIMRDRDKLQVRELLSAPCEKCCSSLLSDDLAAFLSLILTLIGLKLVNTFHQLWSFLSHTLLYMQADHHHLQECCHRATAELAKLGCITLEAGASPKDATYTITELGHATYRGSIPVRQAQLIYQDLMKGHKCMVLSTDLHLLYLATPPESGTSLTFQPNWMVYFEMVTGLGADELKVAELVGIEPAVLSRKATGTAGKMDPLIISLYVRFYLSLMLYCIVKRTAPDAVWTVAETFHCSRGFVQTLLNTATSFASCLVHFAQELPGLWPLTLLLPVIGKKLSYASSVDLAPLLEISGIKQGRARQLTSVGIATPQQLATADPHMLCQDIDHLYYKQAKRLVNSAKTFLSEQAEALLEEAEELMSLLPQ